MTDAPERIWAKWTEDFGAVQIGTWADTVRFEPLGIEYIRADLHAAAIARVEQAEIEADFFQGEVKLRNRIPATSDSAADLLRRAERAEAALTIAEEALRGAIDAIDAAYDGPGDNGAYTVRERAALAKIEALNGGAA